MCACNVCGLREKRVSPQRRQRRIAGIKKITPFRGRCCCRWPRRYAHHGRVDFHTRIPRVDVRECCGAYYTHTSLVLFVFHAWQISIVAFRVSRALKGTYDSKNSRNLSAWCLYDGFHVNVLSNLTGRPAGNLFRPYTIPRRYVILVRCSNAFRPVGQPSN